MKRVFLGLLWSVVILTGCAGSGPTNDQKRADFERTIPMCSGDADCNAKWEAAQLWVVHNAGYKIQTLSNVLIETYNPTQYKVDIAVRVTKEPLGGGRYKIVAKIWCDNMFGCNPNAWDAALAFNRTVAAVVP